MALSDHEQQLLEQMERALASEDPRFADALSGRAVVRPATKNMGIAVLACLAGIAGLIAGVATSQPAIGIVGFVAVVAGLTTALSGLKPVPASTTKKPKRSNGNFMQGLEERWDRRQDNS
ncbi:MAG: DUF3040 domain-containing protein [Actinobacteria bacterium]|uniref:Unannotated protein n=1 Tax=freshwater metagenome TaxID=449393 RepID=A0A6J5ZK04_9ZZZZ|nr:DUF3040 domain-containing protein [Actinomycetota bacterium]